jgi:formate dehydrogenase subunit gamma
MSTRAQRRSVSGAATTPALAPAGEAAASPAYLPGGRILRFTRTERGAHWVQALSFLLLLITGFMLQIPSLEGIVGNRALLREVHLSSGFFFFFGPAIIALSGDRRSIAADVRDVDTWDGDDARWLLPSLGRLFGAPGPRQGRFNAGQKLNAIFVVWSTLTFTVTGFIIWQDRRFPADIVNHANALHTTLAYIALLAFLGHLYLATVHPLTRHAFRAITLGTVDAVWAEEHHPKWVEALTAPGVPLGAHAPAHDLLRATIQIVLGAFASLFAARVLFFWIGANVTDKVTGWLYDVTAWPGAASIHPNTGTHVFDWIGLVYCLACLAAWLAADRLRKIPSTR